MKSSLPVVLLGVGFLLCSASRTDAHHPVGSIYDLGQTVSIEGKLVEASIRNPHSFLRIEVTGKDGKKTIWAGEWGKSSEMSQIGVSGATFKVGDYVVVSGAPPTSKTVDDRLLLIRSVIRQSDGQRWNLQTR